MIRTEEEIYKIADFMLIDSPKMSRTYMYCIVREALKGLDVDTMVDRKKAVVESISHYFCVWSDELTNKLAVSFLDAYDSLAI